MIALFYCAVHLEGGGWSDVIGPDGKHRMGFPVEAETSPAAALAFASKHSFRSSCIRVVSPDGTRRYFRAVLSVEERGAP